MLRVTVELVPAGNQAKKRVIGVMEIASASDLADRSDYHVVSLGSSASSRKTGTVRGHERLKWGPWKLVAKAIKALGLDLEGP
jgi:hypothetical protein